MKETVLITGASSGLGYEFAQLFAKNGHNLVLVARTAKKLEEIKLSFPDITVTIIPIDLTYPNAAKVVFDETQKLELQINILINNAGFGLLGHFDEVSIEKQTEMISLNITALTELTYYFLKEMKKKNTGKILNISSTAAFQPGPLMAVYYASKAYVLSFSEALVEELRNFNISVTTLCPGATKTNFASIAKLEGTKLFSSPMPSETVAKKGYDSLLKGRRVVITGVFNQVGAIAAKFLPRSVATKVAKSMGKKNKS